MRKNASVSFIEIVFIFTINNFVYTLKGKNHFTQNENNNTFIQWVSLERLHFLISYTNSNVRTTLSNIVKIASEESNAQ